MTEFVNSPDGVRIAYEVHGSGSPALVLVHGWSCDRSYWAGQIDPLSRRYRVVAVDYAGHGDSGLDRKDWTIASFGADVAAVVNRLDLDEVVLIGHSLGGDVIVDAARLLPGRVRGLVWVDVYNQLDRFRTRAEIDERSAPFHASFVERTREFVRVMFPRGADPALVERVATDMSAAPPEVALPLLNAAWTNGPHLIATLDELNLPVVALNADDQPTNVASMKRHGVDVTVMSGVGHFLMMEDPERFNEILIGVVEALHRRESAVGS